MRNPRDFFKPLAVGAPEPAARDPVQALADDPLPRLLEREDGREGARHRAAGRHPARQPRGRRPGRPQGGRARRAWSRSARRSTSATPSSGRASTALESPWVLDDLTTLVTEIGDKLDVIMVPKVEGAVGHPLRRPPARPARGQGRRSSGRSWSTRSSRPRWASSNLEEIAAASPAHAGHELRPGRPRRLAAHEDDARRRRPPRLPRDRGPGPGQPRRAARRPPAGPVALLDRAHGRRLHGAGHPAVLRPVRRHQGRRGLRDAVPRRLPARLRRRLVAAPGPDRRSPRRSSRPTPTRSRSPRR